MESDILKKFEEQDAKLDKIYASAESTRKYIKWSVIAGIVLFVLPLIGLVVLLPAFLRTYLGGFNLNF